MAAVAAAAGASVAMPWLAPVLGGIGLLTSVGTMIGAGKQRREQERRLKRRENTLDAMFNKEYKQDVLSTSYAKSAMKKIREALQEGTKRDQNTTAITGGSDEAAVAAKGARFKGLSDAVTSIAMYGDQKKENLLSNYWGQKGSIDAQKSAISEGKVGSFMNMGNNIWNALGTVSKFASLPGKGGTPVSSSNSTTGSNSPLIDQTDPQYDQQANALAQLN